MKIMVITSTPNIEGLTESCALLQKMVLKMVTAKQLWFV
jgi:hypothetical protein